MHRYLYHDQIMWLCLGHMIKQFQELHSLIMCINTQIG